MVLSADFQIKKYRYEYSGLVLINSEKRALEDC